MSASNHADMGRGASLSSSEYGGIYSPRFSNARRTGTRGYSGHSQISKSFLNLDASPSSGESYGRPPPSQGGKQHQQLQAVGQYSSQAIGLESGDASRSSGGVTVKLEEGQALVPASQTELEMRERRDAESGDEGGSRPDSGKDRVDAEAAHPHDYAYAPPSATPKPSHSSSQSSSFDLGQFQRQQPLSGTSMTVGAVKTEDAGWSHRLDQTRLESGHTSSAAVAMPPPSRARDYAPGGFQERLRQYEAAAYAAASGHADSSNFDAQGRASGQSVSTTSTGSTSTSRPGSDPLRRSLSGNFPPPNQARDDNSGSTDALTQYNELCNQLDIQPQPSGSSYVASSPPSYSALNTSNAQDWDSFVAGAYKDENHSRYGSLSVSDGGVENSGQSTTGKNDYMFSNSFSITPMWSPVALTPSLGLFSSSSATSAPALSSPTANSGYGEFQGNIFNSYLSQQQQQSMYGQSGSRYSSQLQQSQSQQPYTMPKSLSHPDLYEQTLTSNFGNHSQFYPTQPYEYVRRGSVASTSEVSQPNSARSNSAASTNPSSGNQSDSSGSAATHASSARGQKRDRAYREQDTANNSKGSGGLPVAFSANAVLTGQQHPHQAGQNQEEMEEDVQPTSASIFGNQGTLSGQQARQLQATHQQTPQQQSSEAYQNIPSLSRLKLEHESPGSLFKSLSPSPSPVSSVPPSPLYASTVLPAHQGRTVEENAGNTFPHPSGSVDSVSGGSSASSSGGRRMYECKVCGRSFPRPSALTVHERIHSGEKPFVCEDCGRPFTVASNLRRHQRIHVKQSILTDNERTGGVPATVSPSNASTIKPPAAVRAKLSNTTQLQAVNDEEGESDNAEGDNDADGDRLSTDGSASAHSFQSLHSADSIRASLVSPNTRSDTRYAPIAGSQAIQDWTHNVQSGTPNDGQQQYQFMQDNPVYGSQ